MTISDVSPRDQLPPLSTISQLPRQERRHGLERWVSWLNVNRHAVSDALVEQLDQALRALRHEETTPVDLEALDRQFDGWLGAAGEVGVGRSPDHEREGGVS